MNIEKEQERLRKQLRENNWYREQRWPIYKCPDCGTLNRYIDTFGTTCTQCDKDLTLDWDKYIVTKEDIEDD